MIAAGGGVLELALSKGLLDEVQARQIENAAIAQASEVRRQDDAARGPSAMNTQQRVAVVTGANRGIGLEICRQLADLGYQVVLATRDAGRAAKLAAELDASHPDEVTSVRLDVADDGSVQTAFQQIRERHHRIDVLVNNAGIAVDDPDHRPSAPDLPLVRRTLETNLPGAWRCCAEVVPRNA